MMQGFASLCWNASRSPEASYPLSAKSRLACGRPPNSTPPMVANLSRRHDEPDRPTLRIGEGVTRGKRWSGIFDRFAAPLSFGMGFMSGGGFQVLVGDIMGLSGCQQPMR